MALTAHQLATHEKPLSGGRTRFLNAIEAGEFADAQALLDRGAQPWVHDRTGRGAIFLCSGHVRSQKTSKAALAFLPILLSRGLSAGAADKNGKTPLMQVCGLHPPYSPWKAWVEALLEAGANINAIDHDGQSALALLCHARSFRMIEDFLAFGAQPVRRLGDDPTWTELDWACTYASQRDPECVTGQMRAVYLPIVKALLAHGAAVSDRTMKLVVDNHTETRKALAMALIESGATHPLLSHMVAEHLEGTTPEKASGRRGPRL